MTDHREAVEALEPCPFCGGGETSVDVRRLSPTMQGPGAIISVTVRHHCPKIEGQPTGLNVSMHGRDEASARAAWNRRSSLSDRVEEARKWQPIETAPKDGTKVLVCDASDYSRVWVARWEFDIWARSPGSCVLFLTHWQPLPSPPLSSLLLEG